MKVALDLIFKHNITQLNPDIVQVRDQVQEEKRRIQERSFKDESRRKKAERLFREFDTIRDHKEAEKQMIVLCNSEMDPELSPQQAQQWKEQQLEYFEQYARFSLKYHKFETAEYYLQKRLEYTVSQEVINHGGALNERDSVRDRIVLASLYIQQGQFRQAKELIMQIIVHKDWKSINANLLFALMYEKLDEAGLQRKHLAIAKVRRMRDLNLLPPKNMLPKNFRTTQTEMKVEIIDFKQVNTIDQKLSADNADNLYLEFIDFLLENMIFDLADSLL